MVKRTHTHPNRPGRPAGPTEGRGEKPYDPRCSTARRQEIIRTVHRYRNALENGDLTLCDLAAMLGTSPSYLSIVKNSPWGQQRLRAYAVADTQDARPAQPQ